MELFRVETGAVPAQSCSEETMPMLKRSPKKADSKVFLVNDSLASIANLSLMFADPSKETKEYSVNSTSPVRQKDCESDLPKYLQLSPKNLEDPVYPSTKSNLFEKINSETEVLLEKTNGVINTSEKRGSRPCSRRPLNDEVESGLSSTILAIATSQLEQTSTSSACQSGDSPPGLCKKKTLGELAKEWNSNQSPEEKKAQEIKVNKTEVNKTVVATDESDHALVRHSTYYSTSSSVHGESSHECRLRNKLKTRRHLSHNEAYQVKKSNSPSLLQLHAIATE